jgi:ribosome-binding factor A
MRHHRKERMESLIKEHLAKLILQEFEFPAIVTLSQIKIDDEFSAAIAKIKIIPKNLKQSNILEVKIIKELNENRDRIFRILLKKLNIKPLPKIKFEIEKDKN